MSDLDNPVDVPVNSQIVERFIGGIILGIGAEPTEIQCTLSGTPVMHPTLQSARSAIAALGDRVWICYVKLASLGGEGITSTLLPTRPAGVAIRIITGKGQFAYRNRTVDGVVLVGGHDNGWMYVPPITLGLYNPNRIWPTAARDKHQAMCSQEVFSQYITEEEVVVYATKDNEVYEVLQNPQYSMATRVGTCIFYFFPYVRLGFAKRYHVIPFIPSNPDQPDNYLDLTPDKIASVSREQLAYLGIYLIGPSHTLNINLKKQIHNRLKAIKAVYKLSIPDESLIDTKIMSLGFVVTNMDSTVFEMIGQALAVNKEEQFDLEVIRSNLIDLADARVKYNLPNWWMGLADQMRLVYDGKNVTSLRFGVQALTISSKMLSPISERGKVEIDRLVLVEKLVRESPFVGLCITARAGLRISELATPVLFGVYYYEFSLETDAERELFKNYNKESIERHIGDKALEAVIKALAKAAPKPILSVLSNVIATVSIEHAELLLAGKTPQEINIIYKNIIDGKLGGAWAAAETFKRKHEYITKATNTAREMFKGLLERFRDEIDSIIDDQPSTSSRNIVKKKISELKSTLLGAVDPDENIEVMLAPTHDLTLVDVRDSMIRICKDAQMAFKDGLESLKSSGVTPMEP